MDIVSLIDTTPLINSPLGIAQGAAGLSAYQVWLSVGNVGTVQQYLDSLKGEAGLDASFRVIDFDPVSGGGAADFIADQDSTVVTPTIIGSENNGTSPTYNDGSFEVNYESATIIYVDAGDMTLSASPDVDRVQVVYFHDGSVTTADYWDGVEAGSLAIGIGAAVVAHSALGDTNVSLTLASAPTMPQIDTLTGGDPSFIEVDGTNISVAALTDILDLSTYPHCTYIITQDPTVGAPANVPDIDYLSNFTQAVHDTPIPDDAIDGNYLKIITNDGAVLGDSVIIGDWCQLYDSKTKIHIEAAGVPWSGVTGTPTTLAGYGVTDPIVLTSVLNVFTKSQIVAPVINNTATGTVTPDMSDSNNFEYTLTGNLTIANPTTAATNFQSGLFRLKQDGTGGRTIAFGAKFKFKTSPVFSTAVGAVDYVSYIYNSTDDRYDCLLNAGF